MTWAERIINAFQAGKFTEADHELAMRPITDTDLDTIILRGHFNTAVLLDSPQSAAKYYVELDQLESLKLQEA
jgi:hypothetical protein